MTAKNLDAAAGKLVIEELDHPMVHQVRQAFCDVLCGQDSHSL